MDKVSLKKNRLDIEYKFESQKALICFTAGTITLIGFLAAMIMQKQYVLGGALGVVIFSFSVIAYKAYKRKLDGILEKIETL